MNGTSICAFCARMKRGRLYACARKNGFNVLALGQHMDDLAEDASSEHAAAPRRRTHARATPKYGRLSTKRR